MAGSVQSTGTLRRRFVEEVNAAASRAAGAYRGREATAGPRSAFWIALGQVAQGQAGGGGRRWTRPLVDRGLWVWRVVRGALSGSWRALRRVIPGRPSGLTMAGTASAPAPAGGRTAGWGPRQSSWRPARD